MNTRRHLPSFTALRAFEAAAECENFVQAAAQLHVTPAAVGQQIRSLESLVGVKLFVRAGRSVRLTTAGRQWLPEVKASLDNIQSVVEKVQGKSGQVLTITTAPSLASRWLMERLHHFTDAHADLSVRVLATPELVDLRSDGIGLAIRFGPGDYPGLIVERLLPEYLIPVCAPSLLADGPQLETPSDLRHYPLIHDESISLPGGCWRLWLNSVGAQKIDAESGARFGLADLALQSAVHGHGVVLARWQLCSGDVRAGRLMVPFPQYVDCPYAYHVVTTPELHMNPEVSAFREWLFTEAAKARAPA